MSEWEKYVNAIEEQCDRERRARMEAWDQVDDIRRALGVDVLALSEEPTDEDIVFLHQIGIRWEPR